MLANTWNFLQLCSLDNTYVKGSLKLRKEVKENIISREWKIVRPNRPLKTHIVDFCVHTTVHGLHFLIRLSHRWIQLFWSLVVLGGFVGVAVHMFYIIHAYLQYKTTEYSYEENHGFLFPDVTICNLNGISASNLKNAAPKYDQIKYYLNRTSVESHLDDPPLPADLFWALGEGALEVGHSFSDFVIRCKFEDRLYNSTNFVIYPFSSFFNCYIFKIGRSGRRTITQGIAAGLSLTLFLEPLDTTIVRNKCGCFPTIYKVRRNYMALNETSCGSDTFKPEKNNMMVCQKKYLKDTETRLHYAKDCNCYPPCEDIKYSTTLSQSEFPSENSMTSFWKTLLENNPNKERLKAYKYYHELMAENASRETMSEWTQKHFLRLTVYANSKTVTIK